LLSNPIELPQAHRDRHITSTNKTKIAFFMSYLLYCFLKAS
jgi:hypothetical protein